MAGVDKRPGSKPHGEEDRNGGGGARRDEAIGAQVKAPMGGERDIAHAHEVARDSGERGAGKWRPGERLRDPGRDVRF